MIASAAERVARTLGGASRSGPGWRARCPAHDDSRPSLSLADGPQGRLLVKCHAGCSQDAVIDALKERGLWPHSNDPANPAPASTPRSGARSALTPCLPVPPDAPAPCLRHPLYGEATTVWAYRNASGALLFHVARFHPSHDDKTILPLTYCRDDRGNHRWAWQGLPSPRPLYGLDRLAARRDASVLVAEGEKAADAAATLFPDLVTITSPNGADAAAKADWAPLAGRRIIVWPDHDEPGRRYAEAVGRLAAAAGAASVRVVSVPPPFPEHWDLADKTPDGVTLEDLRDLVRAAAPLPTGGVPAARSDMVEALPDSLSDDAVALEFADRYAQDLRYVASWNRWLRWTGECWAIDDTLDVSDLARRLCRKIGTMNPKHARAVASARTVAAVVSLARADRRIAATIDQWDADPWLLNTPGGIVDLRTGALQRQRRDAYTTKLAAVTPGGDCPRWQTFLDRITGGDVDLCAYLQRLSGYALTGVTREQTLHFAHGLGRNGKSVFVRVLAGVIGTYAMTAPMETFTSTAVDRHPTEVARMVGARLVTATETEEGRQWAEARIKALTGGDKIAARFMRGDFFEYVPQFKLLIVGNHKPSLKHVGEAIRRRFHLIPFSVTIAEDEVDRDLLDKLMAEAPGILAWAIDGCLAWQQRGLDPPTAVRAATESYFEQEDAFGQWIEEACERKDWAHETAADLYASWRMWADRAGEHGGTMKAFSQNMIARGFHQKRQGRTGRAGFQGVRLVRQIYVDSEGRGEGL